jgi:acetyl esterase/lipase
MAMSALMAIQAAHVDAVPLPAGVITVCGVLDATFSHGMRQPCQAIWETYANPHELTGHFKPSPALPEFTLENIHPWCRNLTDSLHPLASPIACPDEMFKSFPPMLMFMGSGDFFCEDICNFLTETNKVYFSKKAFGNGASLQFFLHENMPHVFPMHNLVKVPSFQEGWKEVQSFIRDVADGNSVIARGERVHWDGSREDIAEEDYITLSNEEVLKSATALILASTTDETESSNTYEALGGNHQTQS